MSLPLTKLLDIVPVALHDLVSFHGSYLLLIGVLNGSSIEN